MRRVVKVVKFFVFAYVPEGEELLLGQRIVQVGILEGLRGPFRRVNAPGPSLVLEVPRLLMEVWRGWLPKGLKVPLTQLVYGLNLADLLGRRVNGERPVVLIVDVDSLADA